VAYFILYFIILLNNTRICSILKKQYKT